MHLQKVVARAGNVQLEEAQPSTLRGDWQGGQQACLW